MEGLTEEIRSFILTILDQANDLTLATNRADGYPQATSVSFVHDGLILYVGCGVDSQKLTNVSRDGRVSLTVDIPYANWMEIKGLSMAADARVTQDAADLQTFFELLGKKFPQAAEFASEGSEDQMALLRIEPKVISMLDYTKGFGHTSEVQISPSDIA